MQKNKLFFQDFLFNDMPVDDKDNPIVDLMYLDDNDDNKNHELVSFDRLMKMNKLEEWERLYESIDESIVYILDDIKIENCEVLEYKEFYLKTYYYNISKRCKECYILKNKNCE